MFYAVIRNYQEKKSDERVEFLTLIVAVLTLLVVLFTVGLLYVAMAESERNRFNIAWLLLNSPPPTCQKPELENEIAGGGRQDAFKYLKSHAISLQGVDISRQIFSYVKLDAIDLNRSTMCWSDLFGSDLRDSSLWGGHMSNANLEFAQLQGADLEYADLRCADMRGAHLQDLDCDDLPTGSRNCSTTRQSIIHKLKLILNEVNGHDRGMAAAQRPGMVERNMVRTNLKNAKLNCAHLEGADLRHASLQGAKLNHAHFQKYKDTLDEEQTCKVGNDDIQCRKSVGLIGLAGLSSDTDPTLDTFCGWFANNVPKGQAKYQTLMPKFCEAANSNNNGKRNLGDSRLMRVTSADLSNADLTGADLSNADLTGADLSNAKLTGADLSNADLTDAINVSPEQLGTAKCICNTTLPTYISGVDRNRNCGETL